MTVLQADYPAAELKDLPALRNFIQEAGERLGAAPDPLSEIIVAANEALSNILGHGYGEQPGPLTIQVAVVDQRLELRLHDRGPAFDPTAASLPDPTLPLDQRAVGGLGVAMIRAFADEIHYDRGASGNVLTLVKHKAC
ncbi:MAG: ATP-binding protein [Candidatus Promineifilaceae bacterium]|nr:ATP-binding protein [Candidatus Promineifilaceae bacterium]